MSKTILPMAAAMLICMVVTSAQADQSISTSTLDEMGLSGLIVMSDSDAMSVRGMGYSNGGHGSKKNHHSKKKSQKSSASASGKSWAEVEFEGDKLDVEAEAGTNNRYDAKGKYEASGDNFSEAKMTKSWSKEVEYTDGTTNIETKTFKVHVEAGGWSSAKAF